MMRFVQKWKLRRHLKNHAREKEELQDKVRELGRIKSEHEAELRELEYHEKLWNSVQLDK
jgi:hypothetical protein